jgi:cytochrome c556
MQPRCRAAAVLWVVAGATALAADPHVIDARIANFREIGTAFKQAKDELKSKQPDLGRVRDAARLIKDRGAEIPLWFPPGSEPATPPEQSWLDSLLGWFGVGGTLALPDEAESRAKIEVWTARAQFEAAHRTFALEAENFWQAMQNGDKATIEAQFQTLGNTCESCHEKFREEED